MVLRPIVPTMEHDLLLLLMNALSGDPARAGFEVHYQPIVRLDDTSIVAVEAFARWQHPVIGSVSPSVFVSLAKRAGLSSALDDFVLDRSCADAVALASLCGREIDVHVNIPAARLETTGLEAQIDWLLKRHRIRPGRLILEFNETARIVDLNAAAASVRRIRSSGVGTALDGFGAGIQLLAQLHVLPVDIIKLEALLMSPDNDAWRSEAVCRSILGVCEQMSLRAVAEGVESSWQADALRQMQCHLGQGRLYGTPLPLGQLALSLRRKSVTRSNTLQYLSRGRLVTFDP